jgi:hypothetical protein
MTRAMVEEQCPQCGVRFKQGAKYLYRNGVLGDTAKTCPNGHTTLERVLRQQRRARETAALAAVSSPASPIDAVIARDFSKRGTE